MPSPIILAILYTLIWWTTLFMVLPFAAHPDPAPDPVSGLRGGTGKPPLVRVVLINTAFAALLWAGAVIVIAHRDWFSFRHGWLTMPGV